MTDPTRELLGLLDLALDDIGVTINSPNRTRLFDRLVELIDDTGIVIHRFRSWTDEHDFVDIPPDPAALIAAIEPIDFRPPPAPRGDEYATWVTEVLDRAESALNECGLTAVNRVTPDVADEVEHLRAESMFVGEFFVVSGSGSGENRWEGLALVHFTADDQIQLSPRT